MEAYAIPIMLIVMFGLMIIGVPIGASLSLGIFALLALDPVTNMMSFAQTMYSGLASYSMLCIPFFMLAGSIMDTGGLSRKLVSFANSLVGNITGGLGMVSIISCMFFGAVSGSAAATTAAIGVIMIPQMVAHGYDKYYATGLIAVAGGLGVIVPPSYPMVLYGCTNGVSIADLFLAGFVPACVVGGILMIFNYVICKKKHYGGAGVPVTLKNVLRTAWDAKWAILMPVIILGGIYGGIFTATEASVVACVYGIIIGRLVYRELKWKSLFKMFMDNTVMVGGMMLVFAPAAAMGSIFALLQIPTAINNFFLGLSQSPYVILTFIIILMTFVGMFVNTTPAILILSPLLLSLVQAVGVNPVHFGIIMTISLCLAFVTPPVAINLFVATGMTGLNMTRIFKIAIPFVIALYVALFVISFVPGISLVLVS